MFFCPAARIRIGVDFGWRRDKQVDFDFKILTALKGWVGLAPQGRGALHIIK